MTTQAVILAAGQGTRLRPLTDDRPKCMVPLAGTPLLMRQAQTIETVTGERPLVVVGYRGEHIADAGFDAVANANFASTNMVESLLCARQSVDPAADLLVGYGDIVYAPHVLEALLGNPEPVAIAVDLDWHALWSVRMENPFDDVESMIMDHGRVTQLGAGNPAPEDVQGQYIGLIRIRADTAPAWWAFIEDLPAAARANMYMTELLQQWIDAGHPVGAATFHGGWLEVDSTEDLAAYEARPDLIERTEA